MEATRATEQSQGSKRQIKSLDDRYGKIGISAVAAAVRHTNDYRRMSASRLVPQDLGLQDSD
jgi:hypothetical protein